MNDLTMKAYINQPDNWPQFRWDKEQLISLLGLVRNVRGRLFGKMKSIGFEGKVTTSKWAKITKCSADTALRDIQDLINKQILRKEQASGRSTSYELLN